MKIDLSQFRQTFMQESAEHVDSMESGLLDLRSSPEDVELLNAIFRSAHSIKGGAGSFGLTNLVRFTHALENLLDRLRSLELPATADVIDLLLRSVDILGVLLHAAPEEAMPDEAVSLVMRIEALMDGATDGATDGAPGASPGTTAADTAAQAESAEDAGFHAQQYLYRIGFRPGPEMFSSGNNPIVLLRNLAELGTVRSCELCTEALPALAELDPERCYLSWKIELASGRPETELREVFDFVEHLAAVDIVQEENVAQLDHHAQLDPHEMGPMQGEMLALARSAFALASEAVRTTAVATTQTFSIADPGRQFNGEEAKVRKGAVRPKETERRKEESSSIRVATDKVDRLIDLVGELVIAHVMTAQMVEDFEPACLPRLRAAVAAMERGTRELHERVMAVRMLPVGTLFQRYARVVYDIAQATGKRIQLDTAGEETEIDKSMLELLGDPLTHIIRNSADHGIELPEVRKAAGKPEEGLIRLRAFHRSGRIVIEISDDGAGIDTVRVRAKAVERGLIAADAQLSEDQLRMLIFEAGFSTREQVSDLSGRGVGMDVVKRNVQQLNGVVKLASEKGKGSTVSIELPLTLAILEGLLVRVAQQTLVLPLLAVIETVAPQPGQLVRVAEQGEVVVVRGESIPLLRLHRFLGLPDEPDGSGQESATAAIRSLVVVVEADGKKCGLVVDELLGQQQVVVKSLEKNLRKIDGLMGATILGDGCVAAIVDVAGLAELNLFGLQALEARPALYSRIMSATGIEKGESAYAMV
jgi:two-component system chemotaxis sensor kinase CheA